MYKILIVEDDIKIAEELSIMLSNNNYLCSTIKTFKNVCENILKENPSIVLLDVNLPNYDGYCILRDLREKSDIPVIIVTSRDSDVDELMSMNLGADDFITKPYNHNILLARISRIINRVYKGNFSNILSYGDLQLDISKSVIISKGMTSELTKNEGRIMECLISNSNTIVIRDELIEYLWQSNEFVDDNTLTVNINRLRKKLKDIGLDDFIQTKRGKGYTLK